MYLHSPHIACRNRPPVPRVLDMLFLQLTVLLIAVVDIFVLEGSRPSYQYRSGTSGLFIDCPNIFVMVNLFAYSWVVSPAASVEVVKKRCCIPVHWSETASDALNVIR
ncbi:hypothetical protein C8R43DRAFT_955677 [Mycena crocata]|nr:hypothetical protein C8R43DRAFT_955677 [Mycena crocata]